MSDFARPIFFHDTYRILYANGPACALFKCEPAALSDRDILDLIVGDDFKTLAKIHLQVIREHHDSPVVEYPWLRCDLTVFWAKVTTEYIGEGIFSARLKHTFEEWT